MRRHVLCLSLEEFCENAVLGRIYSDQYCQLSDALKEMVGAISRFALAAQSLRVLSWIIVFLSTISSKSDLTARLIFFRASWRVTSEPACIRFSYRLRVLRSFSQVKVC